jgi:glucose-1-phosphate thymidylyltransferase
MKAIIPVAGAGTRLRPHTYTQPKSLMPVGGKTILSFIIDELIAAEVTDFIFVIGYLGEKVKQFVERNYPTLNAKFIEQKEREGLGHAVWLTKHTIADNEPLVIVLGDTIVDVDWKSVVQCSECFLGVKKVDDPRAFGLAEIDEENNITRVVEKPNIPKTNMALVGLYKICNTKALFDALDFNIHNNVRTKDQFHLTDALQHMIDSGVKFKALKVNNWFDCGQKDVLLETNSLLLKRFSESISQPYYYTNTIVIPPVSIGKNCKISGSIIGPDVTIGEGSVIENSIITNSIIGDFARLQQIVLKASLIGSDTEVKGLSQSLNIGDNTEIDLS